MRIRVVLARNYRKPDLPKLEQALNQLHAAVNSIQFYRELLNHVPFHTDRDLTNKQIYAIIMAGREMGSEADNEADLSLSINENFNGEAFGYMQNGTIHTFRNQFDSHSPAELAGHYAHEYCHTLGFRDPDSLNETKLNVPYEVGSLVTKLAQGSGRTIELA